MGQHIRQKQSDLCEWSVLFKYVSAAEGILLRSEELLNWNTCDSPSFWGEKHQQPNGAVWRGALMHIVNIYNE